MIHTTFPVFFDLETDSYSPLEPKMVPMNSVILIDGIFLQRKELRDIFDFVIFAAADFQVTLSRMLARNKETANGDEEIITMFNGRYHPAQEMYLEECMPQIHADVTLDNNDMNYPILLINSTDKYQGSYG